MKKPHPPTTFAFPLPSNFGFPYNFFKKLDSLHSFLEILFPFFKKGVEKGRILFLHLETYIIFDSFCVFWLENFDIRH